VHRRSDALSKRPRREQALRETRVHACELRGELLLDGRVHQIAEKLRCQAFFIDNRLSNTREAPVLCAPRPCAAARALQVDRGDLPVSCGWTRAVKFDNRAHAAAAKRFFRLPRPVLSKVEIMVLTTMSGWLLAMGRHDRCRTGGADHRHGRPPGDSRRGHARR
jgi:hypothetical protein